MAKSGSGFTSNSIDTRVFADHPPILRKDINDAEWTDSKAVLVTFMSIINVFMLFGNTLSIVAICYTKKLRQQVSYWFVMNLAVIDLIISVTVVPINIIWEFYGTWPFSKATCEFFTFADISFSTISAYSIVLVSIDKYIYITYSIHYYDKMTRKIALLLIGGVWTMVFIFAMVSILTKVGTDEYYEDHFLVLPNNTNICVFVMTDAYVLPSVIISFFIPFLILCFTSSRITCIASKHIKKIHTVTISMTSEFDSESTITTEKRRPRRHTVIGSPETKTKAKTIGFRKISSEKNVLPTKYKKTSELDGETNLGYTINETAENNERKTTQETENSKQEPKQEIANTNLCDKDQLEFTEKSDTVTFKNKGHDNSSGQLKTSKGKGILSAKFQSNTDNNNKSTDNNNESTENNNETTENGLKQSKSNEIKTTKSNDLKIPESRDRSESMRSYKLRQSDSIKSVLKKSSPYCKLFGTVTIVIACFILMFAPYNIAIVIDVPCHCIEPWVYEDILAVLYYMHSLVNPYIYMATDRKYKAALKILWKNVKAKFRCK